LPFAAEFFDAIVSIDSYFYYGTDDLYLNTLARFVKPGGQVGIAGAGLMRELDDIPEHLQEWWTADLWCLHSAEWWRRHWGRAGILKIEAADALPEGWQLWLEWLKMIAPDNTTEIQALEADAGRNLGYVRAVGRRGESVLMEPITSMTPQYAKKPLLRKWKGMMWERAVKMDPLTKAMIVAKVAPDVLDYFDAETFSWSLGSDKVFWILQLGSLLVLNLTQRHLKLLLASLIAALIIPGSIALASLTLGRANETAGWMRYRLPATTFWIFIGASTASPLLGLVVLVLLAVRKRSSLQKGNTPELQILLITFSIVSILFPVLWFFLLGEVFFLSGGSR
jgi:hypothetical protein